MGLAEDVAGDGIDGVFDQFRRLEGVLGQETIRLVVKAGFDQAGDGGADLGGEFHLGLGEFFDVGADLPAGFGVEGIEEGFGVGVLVVLLEGRQRVLADEAVAFWTLSPHTPYWVRDFASLAARLRKIPIQFFVSDTVYAETAEVKAV